MANDEKNREKINLPPRDQIDWEVEVEILPPGHISYDVDAIDVIAFVTVCLAVAEDSVPIPLFYDPEYPTPYVEYDNGELVFFWELREAIPSRPFVSISLLDGNRVIMSTYPSLDGGKTIRVSLVEIMKSEIVQFETTDNDEVVDKPNNDPE